MTRRTGLNLPKLTQSTPKWRQNVTQAGSFHGTEDGVCGYLSDGVCSVGRSDVGTLDGLYQHTLIATGTRLRPLRAPFLGHILGTKPAKNMGG